MRNRLRSTIKWSGTVLSVVLLVVWVGSAWWGFSFYLDPTFGLAVAGGLIVFGWREPWTIIPAESGGWFLEPHSFPMSWWFGVSRDTPPTGATTTLICVPIWALAILLGTLTVWLWLRDRRRAPGLCSKCGYNLRGNASGVCPECGAAAPRELKVEQVSRRA